VAQSGLHCLQRGTVARIDVYPTAAR